MISYIDTMNLRGKNVFLRLDLNVPLDSHRKVADDTRIREALPTIKYCLEQGAKLILCSHFGRPDGKRNPEFSLEPVGQHLAELIGREVILVDELTGDGVHHMIRHGRKGDEIFLLENIRFHPGEEKNDDELARELARLGDVFINDAFGASHRKHASIVGIANHMSEVGAGFLIQKELRFLERLVREPEQPFALVVGGAKVTDKLKAIENLINHVDRIIVGGAMAYAFLAASGKKIGGSKCEKDGIQPAKQILDRARARNVKVYLPEDHVVVYPEKDPKFTKPSTVATVDIPEGAAALDIGPKTIASFEKALVGVKTVFWNGPLGFFEREGFGVGTKAIGEAISRVQGVRVAGGGDTISAIHMLLGESADFDLLSTGGGASLQYLEGRGLPGIDILMKKGASGRQARGNQILNTDDEA